MNTYKIDKDKLKYELNDSNIKQSLIAFKMGVSERTVSRWVTGKVVFIKYHNLKSLCSILLCELTDITVKNDDDIADTLIENNLLEKLSPYGDFDLIEKIFLKTLTEVMTDHRRAEILLVLANTNWRNKKYVEARDYIDKALKLSQSKPIQFEAYFHLGTIFSINGYAQALKMLLMSYDLREHAKSPDRIASLCNNISMMYREMGIIDKALIYMEEAYEYFEIEDKYYNLCITCQGFMTIYNELGQAEKALAYAESGKKFAGKSHYDNGHKSILLYELDTYSQLKIDITEEHQHILNDVFMKKHIDYYALEAVFKYLISINSKQIADLYALYINEVPLFVKAMINEIVGNKESAMKIYDSLGISIRKKSLQHLDL